MLILVFVVGALLVFLLVEPDVYAISAAKWRPRSALASGACRVSSTTLRRQSGPPPWLPDIQNSAGTYPTELSRPQDAGSISQR